MNDLQPSALDTYWATLRDIASWIASAIGVAAAMGWVNLAVGVLSAVWLATQIYRFWRWEVYALRRRHDAETAATTTATCATTERPAP